MSTKALKISLSILLSLQFVSGINIISRSEWQAKSPKSLTKSPNILSYVIIHHSDDPSTCHTPQDCRNKMKQIQNSHLENRKWSDIGYNFIIGGDGNIYEGRGFNIQGSHAPSYNKKSIGICFIGNWSNSVPPKIMLTRAKELIEYAMRNGKIADNYKLLGHRQVKATECPGTALFNEIKSWPHFSAKP